MKEEDIIELIKKYVQMEDTPCYETTIHFLEENGIVFNDESEFHNMHWDSTIDSYFKIPEARYIDNHQINNKIEMLINEEEQLVKELKQHHLNILIKIIKMNNEK